MPENPKIREKYPGTTRDEATVTESFGARSVVFVTVAPSPLFPFLPYSLCATGCAYDQPAGSWDAPARAPASAAACTCCFCKYQPPTSITRPATPINDIMKSTRTGNV